MSSARRSIPARIVEWFWLGQALGVARASIPEPSERAALSLQRARQCAESAWAVANAPEPLERAADAASADLYRQAAYWSLCAAFVERDQTALSNASEDPAVWATLDETVLAKAARSSDRVPALRDHLRAGSLVYFAGLPKSEQLAVRQELCALAQLLSVAGDRDRVLATLYLQRIIRLALALLVVVGVAVLGVALIRQPREPAGNLAAGQPWRASSLLPNSGCESPAQECSESPNLFFHTKKQPNPWLEIDLGDALAFSTVQVVNRPDCCAERAIPLRIEVSRDHKTWSTVARRDTEFKEWRASFPSVRARWVRLQVEQRTMFHLSRVLVFR